MAKKPRAASSAPGGTDGAPAMKAKQKVKPKRSLAKAATDTAGAARRALGKGRRKKLDAVADRLAATATAVVKAGRLGKARKKLDQPVAIGRLERLEVALSEVRIGARSSLRTSRLIASGVPKMAQKVIEEAAETAIEGIRGDRVAFVNETVDLFYNLLVLAGEIGVPLASIFAEMDRRELTLGMAEKLPKVPNDV